VLPVKQRIASLAVVRYALEQHMDTPLLGRILDRDDFNLSYLRKVYASYCDTHNIVASDANHPHVDLEVVKAEIDAVMEEASEDTRGLGAHGYLFYHKMLAVVEGE